MQILHDRQPGPGGRRIAVLGDMLELGAASEPGHRQTGKWAADAADLLVAYGPLSAAMAEAARQKGLQTIHCQAAEEVVEYLRQNVRPGDVVLAKASHAMKLDDVLKQLYAALPNAYLHILGEYHRGMIVSWMLVAAAIGAFAVTALSGCFVIPALHKLHFGQTIRESGPTWHNKKQGTPTMGGLCFIFGILVACGLVYAGFYRYAQDLLGIVQVRAALLALFLAFGSGFIGFLDDYIKVVKHRNLGLLAWQKLIMQFIVTGGFLVGLHMQGLLTTIIMLPFIGAVDLGWVYYPIAFFGIIFLVNAVNLTDGLDGLCSCVTFVSMLGYLLAASMLSFYHVAVLAAATAAAAAGFLVWNFYPAKVFMGDTGSMFLGGMVTALAFIMGRPELVFFFGIVYIWDAMTVVIQRVYFKLTHGKRIFRMTPIHHAFEMRGWKEVKIDFFFRLIAIIGVVLGLMYVYMA